MEIQEMESAIKKMKLEYEKAAKGARLIELKRQMMELEYNKMRLKVEANKLELGILEVEELLTAL